MEPLRLTRLCRECSSPIRPRHVVAIKGKHPDPGKYCCSDCAIAAFQRGWAKAAAIVKGYP